MRILVAGWHGQVARAITERLAARSDVTAYAVGRPAPDLSGNPGIARSLFGIEPDVIINTAAYTAVDAAEDEPARAHRENAVGAGNLAAYAARLAIPIIHLSSAHVFSGNKPAPYVETDEPHPLNAYGRSKLDSERAVAQANSKHIIMRTGWVHSPHGRNFIRSILRRAEEQSIIDVVADELGSPSYAPHLADAILELAATIVASPQAGHWGTYHVANQEHASWHDMAQLAFKSAAALGSPAADTRPISQVDYQTKSVRPANSRLDCSKLERTFAITLPDWQSGVEECTRRILTGSDC